MTRSTEVNNGALSLEYCLGIQFDGRLMTQEEIIEGGRDKGRKSIVRGATLTAGDADREILAEILRTCVPLTIIGDPTKHPLVLTAKLGRYPFHGEEFDYEGFSVMLAPTRGRIGSVGERETDLGTIYTARQSHGLVLAAANRRVQLDLYFEQQVALPSLVPPTAYTPHV